MLRPGLKRCIHILFANALALCSFGCAHSTRSIEPVTDFDPQRYVGRWYEIARFPHRFERGLIAVTADYALQPDGSVSVVNRGFDSAGKAWKQAVGRAYLVGDGDVGHLRVSFFRPFYGAYKILLLDKDAYAYSLVTSGTYDYLWILSRTPTMAESKISEIVRAAEEMGFDSRRLEFVDQSPNIATPPSAPADSGQVSQQP